MKFCKDCKWFEMDETGIATSRCQHPALILESISPVTGEVEREWIGVDGNPQNYVPFCSSARASERPTHCGIGAKLFEGRDKVNTQEDHHDRQRDGIYS